jgi:hypothetical protein
VTSLGRLLPKDAVEHWPEVFGEVKLNVLPFSYLNAVLINFKDGKTWEIKITSSVKKAGWDQFEHNLSELCKSYEEKIDNIDFKLDTIKVKKDIKRSTEKFLKKKKL